MLNAEQAARVDRLFAGWTDDGPGGVLVLLRNGETVLARCFGRASVEHLVPVTAATRFHICSITKTFTGAACALLRLQGRLRLDADVRTYVPELPHAGITVRDLLNMTSGLRDSIDSLVLGGFWYRRLGVAPDLLDLIVAQTTLSFPTGTRYSYTNINFNLLALIVERVSGQNFDGFLADAFWRPLGMDKTMLRESTTTVVADLAEPYVPAPAGWEKGPWSFGVSGAGGLVATAGDLVRWHGMFDAGGMHGLPIVDAMTEPGRLADGTPTQYGLGIGLRPYRGVTVQVHGGGAPGYRTMFARVPERDFALVVLANRSDFDPYARLRDVIDICLGETLAPPPVLPLGLDPATIDGRYLDPNSGEPLTLACNPAAGTIALDKLGLGLTLRPDGGGGFVDDWANFRSTLRIDPDGPALHLDVGGQVGRYEPFTPCAPTAEDRAAVLGRYRCVDMRAEAEVLERDGVLTLRFGPAFNRAAEVRLEPLRRDMFLARHALPSTNYSFAIRFDRRAGRAVGFRVSSSLLKDTAFVRSDQ
jgi:CubicO group peptidase (beta-lactamase class C family)